MPKSNKKKPAKIGRPKGSKNKKTQEVIARAAAEGVMPLDVMLHNMRANHAAVTTLEQKMATAADGKPEAADQVALLALREASETCAKDAAPYLHPRLASVEHKLKPYDLSQLSDKELDQFERLLRLADARRDPGGAPAPAGGEPTPGNNRIH